MKSLRQAFVYAAIVLAAVFGNAAEIRVVTTLPAIHCWASNVAGEDAVVENLLPADVGPHDFQFRPSDRKKVAGADLIFVNGLGVEDWLKKAMIDKGPKGTGRVVALSDGLKSQLIYHLPELEFGDGHSHAHHHHDHDHEAEGEAPNPHIWLDPVFARHCVSNIAAAMKEADPAHADGYSRRAAAYLAELEALDREVKTVVDGLPDKKVITFHDAFPYFCRRYGLDLVGVIQEVPSTEPSPKHFAKLARVIRERKVRAIFVEPQFNPRIATRLAEDLKIKVGQLDVLETGTLSRGFYTEGVRKNLKALEAALR